MTEHDEQHTDRQLSEEAVGALRQRLRDDGWRSDVGWATVGSGSAAIAQGEARRTIAYLASLRAVDGGAAKVWQEGDVPAPPEADAREVLVTGDDDSEWHSEVLEAPAETVVNVGRSDAEELEGSGGEGSGETGSGSSASRVA